MTNEKLDIETFDFEKSQNRIEEIINLLENENISLDISLDLFKEGSMLINLCDEKIKSAKQQITKIVDKNEN